ncbi:flagellar biosynthesis protein FlgA [Gordonia sp. HNM0687]|uniref:Flagellar biosynthesis protein FlgA n=1 Tax=Gordonia mangrovi TaxID=2665643 RepID=A0A6L7GWH0_9ACTN|nr:SAF domain-containing protein [Gordonia mangrovi]MXP22848.1 flagellar biosynthesis protein FlgA [Gordonia mangrovi]UVF77157.1 SAF domain-containing protein [Gordonia mangrovi]
MPALFRGELSPRLVDRVRHLARPGWARSIVVRRVVSGALVLAAVVTTVVGHRNDESRSVVVAAHDLRPGQTVAPDDLSVVSVPGGLIPTGALRMTADATGRTLVGRVRTGEILTDVRLLSSHLPAQLTGRREARLVPVQLADDTVASLLREGDVVDILTVRGGESAPSAVLARAAIVALTVGSGRDNALSPSGAARRPVLLAMAEVDAHRVAAAGLDGPLTVVVH